MSVVEGVAPSEAEELEEVPSGKRKPKRVQHVLRPLRKPPLRVPFVTVDIESKHEDTDEAGFTRPFLVGVYDPNREGGVYRSFRDLPHVRHRSWKFRRYTDGGCVDQALRYLLRDELSGHNIYAHNGGNFDHLFWLRWLKLHDDEFGFEIVPVQSSIQMLRVWRVDEVPRLGEKRKRGQKRREWTFLDSVKLLPMSLKKALKAFDLGAKVEHDLNLPESDPRWEEYLKRDCVGLAEVMKKFHDLIENKLGGEVGITTPATSMKLFLRQYLGKDGTMAVLPRHMHFPGCPDEPKSKGGRLLPTTDPSCPGCQHAWVRRGFFGGRTEIFKLHPNDMRVLDRLHYYDLNSSYVAAMQETMPVGERHVVRGEIDWRLHERFSGFAEVDVYIPESCQIPPLPSRDLKSGKLIFPNGKLRGVWSLEELKIVTDPFVGGEIVRVGRVVWMKRQVVFRKMMQVLWDLRDKNDPAYDEGLSQLAKLLGNALFGKWGMNPEKVKIAIARFVGSGVCFLCHQPAVSMDTPLCADCVGSKCASGDIENESDVWYQRNRTDAPYIMPHISAHITALARVRLWRWLKLAFELGGIAYYGDTDSAVTDVELPLEHGPTCKDPIKCPGCKLGSMKDEHPTQYLRYAAKQPKVYKVEPAAPRPERWWTPERVALFQSDRVKAIELFRHEHGALR